VSRGQVAPCWRPSVDQRSSEWRGWRTGGGSLTVCLARGPSLLSPRPVHSRPPPHHPTALLAFCYPLLLSRAVQELHLLFFFKNHRYVSVVLRSPSAGVTADSPEQHQSPAEALPWLCVWFHFHLMKKLLELNQAAVQPHRQLRFIAFQNRFWLRAWLGAGVTQLWQPAKATPNVSPPACSRSLPRAFATRGRLIWLLGVAPVPAPRAHTFDQRVQLNPAAAQAGSLRASCAEQSRRRADSPPAAPWAPGSTEEFSSNSGGGKWSG